MSLLKKFQYFLNYFLFVQPIHFIRLKTGEFTVLYFEWDLKQLQLKREKV